MFFLIKNATDLHFGFLDGGDDDNYYYNHDDDDGGSFFGSFMTFRNDDGGGEKRRRWQNGPPHPPMSIRSLPRKKNIVDDKTHSDDNTRGRNFHGSAPLAIYAEPRRDGRGSNHNNKRRGRTKKGRAKLQDDEVGLVFHPHKIYGRRSSKTMHRLTNGNDSNIDMDVSDFDLVQNTTTKELRLPKPVIVMGFPKAGTSSIFAFFQRQGLRSQHWYCCGAQKGPQMGCPSLMAGCLLKNLRRSQTKILKGCGNQIDVYAEINGPRKKKWHPFTGKTGWLLDDGSVDFESPKQRIFFPQHFRIDAVHRSYPNATWILNWRDVEPWIDSVMKWGDNLHYQFAYEYYMQGVISHIPQNMTEMRSFLRQIYLQHFEMVRDFVQTHPSHALVEVNITHPEAGQVLADAFGLSSVAWTNVNKNRKGSFEQLWRRRPIWFLNQNEFLGSALWWFFLLGVGAFLYRFVIRHRR